MSLLKTALSFQYVSCQTFLQPTMVLHNFCNTKGDIAVRLFTDLHTNVLFKGLVKPQGNIFIYKCPGIMVRATIYQFMFNPSLGLIHKKRLYKLPRPMYNHSGVKVFNQIKGDILFQSSSQATTDKISKKAYSSWSKGFPVQGNTETIISISNSVLNVCQNSHDSRLVWFAFHKADLSYHLYSEFMWENFKLMKEHVLPAVGMYIH